MDYVTTCTLGTRPEFNSFNRTEVGQKWPWYLRERDGVAETFYLITYHKDMCPDIACFLETIPEGIVIFTYISDILS